MNICLVGINQHTAPVAIREKAAIRSEDLGEALELLRSQASHGVILSTCNRTEVYTIPGDNGSFERASFNFLKTHLDIPETSLLKHAYILEGEEAVEHLFRTASGLDSMVIGEYEILGQLRQALKTAESLGMVNLPLRHIFQSAIRIGRRVRQETGISKSPFSVSSVAVELAVKVLGNLKSCRMLIIGAGEAGKLVAKAAKDRGVSQIIVASRTQARASNLTEMLGGIPTSLDNLEEKLATCNIVVACADAPRYLLDVSRMEKTMSRRPELPLVIIDIAVPRNVEPAVAGLKNVFLHNIDDLSQISEQNRRQRELEVRKVEKIISAELAKFAAWWQGFKVRPLIRAMMSRAEEIRRSHLERTVKKLPELSDDERFHLEMMTRAIVTKILKEPVQNLKTKKSDNNDYAAMAKELFQLDEEKY
ncbi:MAG: glutamyl-tRNA reductase [Dehalococcoidales bacterium]|nr:glutamyl-tRNA reductase [Dehalococcoidales bacterium]